MPELNDQQLRELFQKAGHHVPASDLAARIMARVAVTPIMRPKAVVPLIGPKGWVGIGMAVLAILVGALLAGPASEPGPIRMTEELAGWFHGLNSAAGNWPLWTVGVSTLALVLFLVDRTLGASLAHRQRI